MTYRSESTDNGSLGVRFISRGGAVVMRAPMSWKIRNALRLNFIWMFIVFYAAMFFSKITGVITLTGRLKARLIKADGTIVDYGVIAHGLVTDAWTNFLVDQLQTETSEIGDFKYHDSGVGTTAANAADTNIETTDGEARVAGTQTEGASTNIYRTVGTITYTTSKAITEHGVFSQLAAGTMIDRHVFAAINVVNTDQIEFTYEYTSNSGG